MPVLKRSRRTVYFSEVSGNDSDPCINRLPVLFYRRSSNDKTIMHLEVLFHPYIKKIALNSHNGREMDKPYGTQVFLLNS